MKNGALSLTVCVLMLTTPATASAWSFGDRAMRWIASSDGKDAIAIPDGVKVETDLHYGPDPEQRLDAYRPAHAASAPVLFMVHGGAWMVGDKASTEVVQNKVRRWVPRGYIVVSVNYRLAPDVDPLTQADDVAKALAYAQAKAKTWGGDPTKFVLMGHSAGAHLVALLAADPRIATNQGAAPWLGTVMLDSAAFDLPRIMTARHARFYDRVFKSDPTYWRSASPIYRVQPKGAPVLLVCSSLRAGSCPQAQSFADKINAADGKANVFPVALSHSDINRTLGLAGAYTDAVESFFRSLGLQ